LDGDGVGDVTVFDDGAVTLARDAARGVIGGDGAVGQREVLHLGVADIAEDALVIVSGLFDIDAADGMALAVEDAAEWVVVADGVVGSDGGVVIIAAVVGDVFAQLKVST
jgi:hypothetical protein